MIALDLRTVLILSAVSYLICALFVSQLWWQNRSRFAGMGFWAFNLALQLVALVLIALRGAIPDLISIVLANALVLAGVILNLIGLERFFGKRADQWHNYVLLLVFTSVYAFYTFVQPDLHLRALLGALAMLIVTLQTVWLLWHRIERSQRTLSLWVGLVFAAYSLLCVARIAEYFLGRTIGEDYFRSGNFQAVVLVTYQTLLILLTYSLVLMVNRRLIVELISNQEKFTKAFHAAPYAITLTHVSDGTLFDVNEHFSAITGHQRADALGRRAVDLHLWEHDEDHAALVEAVARNEKVKDWECRFRKKNGEPLVGLLSIERITINGQSEVLSCIADITLRKQIELDLRYSEERYRALVDRAPEGIGVHRDGKLIYVNPAAVSMFGARSAQDLLGKQILDLIHPDYRAMALARIKREMETGVAVPLIEEKFLRLDGMTIDGEIQGTPINYDGARAILVAVRDTTERKQAQEAIRRHAQELEQFNRVMIGRELDMIALKQQVNALSSQLGMPAPFDLHSAVLSETDQMKTAS